METITFTTTIWLIEARTGCSCCSFENFYSGPFLTEEDAKEQIAFYSSTKRLASQFSKTGVYRLEKHEAEQISGGRFIVDDRVWGPEIEEKQ